MLVFTGRLAASVNAADPRSQSNDRSRREGRAILHDHARSTKCLRRGCLGAVRRHPLRHRVRLTDLSTLRQALALALGWVTGRGLSRRRRFSQCRRAPCPTLCLPNGAYFSVTRNRDVSRTADEVEVGLERRRVGVVNPHCMRRLTLDGNEYRSRIVVDVHIAKQFVERF